MRPALIWVLFFGVALIGAWLENPYIFFAAPIVGAAAIILLRAVKKRDAPR